MDAAEKRNKLISLAKGVISNPANENEIKYLLHRFALTEEDLIQAYLDWDLSPDSYGNEIYDFVPIRFAMYLHYLLPGSWHEARQDIITNILDDYPSGTIVDVGFGAPQRYIKNLVLKYDNFKLTLCEPYQSAFAFSEILLSYWNSNWRRKITFKKYDMDKDGYVGDFDTYLFLDSIEHSQNPSKYLTSLVKKSPAAAKFIFSLPVEWTTAKSEYINWSSDNEALNWLRSCGLDVHFSKKIEINPEIDVFAEGSHYHQLIVECSKINPGR
ncbi:MAG: hypothetical protein UX31_C0001G0047 [Candidatus Nomurabacteria bacterium GW2011_GWA1_46_11]|uniref:Methyltransferase type 12 domain-containing protein n=2 Tax=Parcubacteria group TaxID=1794811 RepID=A0A1F8F1G1_9BACT|nr:MAG: hypothetical protein UX31_C0001G0047 [Candidatus Nomurabacteria bacterium GW2011_GWA1_46_11]OGN06076.1 MAG: hypothetical protein A2669_00910 [Candidatus Yanofskybacteria bacterium RIFCSPHIGHO2_01_FULL_48_25b]